MDDAASSWTRRAPGSGADTLAAGEAVSGARVKQLSLGGSFDAPVGPAPVDAALRELAARVPPEVRFGTSSWSFPGWAGLVFDRKASASELAHDGLLAYAKHPLLRTVGLDRGFYAPLTDSELAAYAAAVPADFRFLVKAPAAVTDAAKRDRTGTPVGENDAFLNAALAIESFVDPVRRVLGDKAGPLVFQVSPLPNSLHVARVIAQLDRFLAALPVGPLYAVEVRDAGLVTRELVSMLARRGATYVVSLHPRLPDVPFQLGLVGAHPARPLVARLNLSRLAGQGYEEAKRSFAPFDKLLVPDLETRAALARVLVRSTAGAFVIANNKAEGSAPLTLRALADAAFPTPATPSPPPSRGA